MKLILTCLLSFSFLGCLAVGATNPAQELPTYFRIGPSDSLFGKTGPTDSLRLVYCRTDQIGTLYYPYPLGDYIILFRELPSGRSEKLKGSLNMVREDSILLGSDWVLIEGIRQITSPRKNGNKRTKSGKTGLIVGKALGTVWLLLGALTVFSAGVFAAVLEEIGGTSDGSGVRMMVAGILMVPLSFIPLLLGSSPRRINRNRVLKVFPEDQIPS